MPAAGAPVPRLACAVCGADDAVPVFVKAGWTFVRCRGCGLVSLRPLPTPAELAAHHEASYRAGGYAAFAAAETVRADIARHRLALVSPLAPPGPWLDVGCSTGAFLAEAVHAGRDVEGLELSAAAVAEARRRGLAVHRGTTDDFQPARRYALITAFDVIEHLPDPAAFLGRLASWLAPSSLLALTLPDVASVPARAMGRHWYYYAPPDHVHYFTPATIRALVAAHGFRDVRVEPFRKPLRLDYAVENLVRFNPRLGALAGAVARRLPRAWRAQAWRLPLGEMLVTARSPC